MGRSVSVEEHVLQQFPAGRTTEELARGVRLAHSGAVRLVDRLVEAKLVDRRPGHAGVTLSSDALETAVTSRVRIGVVVGLVVGKTLGITAASWIAVRTGLLHPHRHHLRQLAGVAALGGIGFTVSLSSPDSPSPTLRSAHKPKSGSWPRRSSRQSSVQSCEPRHDRRSRRPR